LRENLTPGSLRDIDFLLGLNIVALLVPKGRRKQRIQSIPKARSLDVYSTGLQNIRITSRLGPCAQPVGR